MNSQHLKTFGLASAIALTTIGSFGLPSSIRAESSLQESQTILAQATENNNFVSVGRKRANGQIKVINENGKKYLEFDKSFSTSNGPDLKVVLHRDSSVSSSIDESDYIEIAPLESTRGQQRYLIPEEVDLSDYGTVAIWCRQFNVTFGYARL